METMDPFYSCEGLSCQRWVAAPLFPSLNIMKSLGQKKKKKWGEMQKNFFKE